MDDSGTMPRSPQFPENVSQTEMNIPKQLIMIKNINKY